ncbi:MAG: hypothetical protein LQ338_008278, partial [Usnochroma carphineum]
EGSQLGNFIQGVTPTRGQPRTCPGPIQDGDTWQIVFDLAGADPSNERMFNSKTQYCAKPGVCGNDQYQFHLTVRNGPLDSPYNPGTMNHYTQEGTGGKDLLQCSVTVHRQRDMFFNVAVFDNTGTQKGTGALSAYSNGGTITVTGLPASLKFTRVGPFAASGAGMSFTYNSTFPFSWFGDTKGSSTYGLASGNYCSVTNSGTASSPVQDVQCYFPCPAA